MLTRVIAGAVALASCSYVPSVPGRGGPAWSELTSEHFTVWTDDSVEHGREVLRRAEHLQQIFRGFFTLPIRSRTVIIALRSQREVEAYVGNGNVAWYYIARAYKPDNPLHQPVVLISPTALDDDNANVLTHELTHAISFEAIPEQPVWFGEGLAGYFETLYLDEPRGYAELGRVKDRYVAELRAPRGAPVSIARMLDCNRSCTSYAYEPWYATAWAMVSFLINKYPDRFVRYATRLNELTLDHASQAWSDVFPELEPGEFGVEIRDWLRSGDATVHRMQVSFQEWPITERPLHDADVFAARGLLVELGNPGGDAPSDVRRAVELDPTNLTARLIQRAHSKPFAAELTRKITEAHPDDWRAWWLAWQTSYSTSDRAKVCELLPKNLAILPAVCPTGGTENLP